MGTQTEVLCYMTNYYRGMVDNSRKPLNVEPPRIPTIAYPAVHSVQTPATIA